MGRLAGHHGPGFGRAAAWTVTAGCSEVASSAPRRRPFLGLVRILVGAAAFGNSGPDHTKKVAASSAVFSWPAFGALIYLGGVAAAASHAELDFVWRVLMNPSARRVSLGRELTTAAQFLWGFGSAVYFSAKLWRDPSERVGRAES